MNSHKLHYRDSLKSGKIHLDYFISTSECAGCIASDSIRIENCKCVSRTTDYKTVSQYTDEGTDEHGKKDKTNNICALSKLILKNRIGRFLVNERSSKFIMFIFFTKLIHPNL